MCARVSSAGIVVDEQRGLLDCGPRRLDPEAKWFRQVQRPLSPLYPTLQSDKVDPADSTTPPALPEHN